MEEGFRDLESRGGSWITDHLLVLNSGGLIIAVPVIHSPRPRTQLSNALSVIANYLPKSLPLVYRLEFSFCGKAHLNVKVTI